MTTRIDDPSFCEGCEDEAGGGARANGPHRFTEQPTVTSEVKDAGA